MADAVPNGHPPRDDLVRALYPGYELRDSEDGTSTPTLTGHFAKFNEWAEINSVFEGRFMERLAVGAFKKTFRENGDRIRVLFQHGRDPQIGDKPLGPITDLREDSDGAYYEVPLLDAPYVREGVLPGLKAGLYGASFRFQVMKEEFEEEPKASKDNPDKLPERTVTEARVMEFGPVTFPAYTGATAGLRSLTDEFMVAKFLRGARPAPRSAWTTTEPQHSKTAATSAVPSRSTRSNRFATREEFLAWIAKS